MDGFFDNIINEHIVENLIDDYNIPQQYKDDLTQEIYLILLQYDHEKLKTLYEKKQLRFYVAKIITNQYFSKTSPFYKTYKKYYTLIDDEQYTIKEEPDGTD